MLRKENHKIALKWQNPHLYKMSLCEAKQNSNYLGIQSSLWSVAIFGEQTSPAQLSSLTAARRTILNIFQYFQVYLFFAALVDAVKLHSTSPEALIFKARCCSLKVKGGFAIDFDESRNEPFICNLKQVG